MLTTQEKISIIKDSFNTLRARGIVKTQGDFARILNISERTLSAAKHGADGYCTENLIEKIQAIMAEHDRQISISHSPHTNVATGQGQITIEADAGKTEVTSDVEMIPVIPQNLYKETNVNILKYVTDEDADVQMSPAVQQFPSTTCYYQVATIAMYPHFHQGDILALKAINKNVPIVNGEVYAIDTIDLGILVRFAYDRGDKIEMRPTNERSDHFEPFFIPKDQIYTIFRIVGLIRTSI